tara:strand:- start:3537 stop:4610 length:1074 start_codon:yes stop_codon:yes gene_type:complete
MDKKNPNFSICIPNYNYGNYIGDTIESVLNQTYQHFEIIIVDNASTDDSVDIIKSFKDNRIKLFLNEYNIGFAPNLQRATGYAQNDFINLLSSDDQMNPTALEFYTEAIRQLWDYKEKLYIVSDIEEFGDNGKTTRLTTKSPNSFARVEYTHGALSNSRAPYDIYSGIEALTDGLSRLSNIGGFCSTVYSKSLWESVEGYNSVRTISPDTHFALKALTKDPVVVHINKPLFRYRIQISDNRASLTKNVRIQMDQYLDTLEFATKEIFSLTGMNANKIQRMFITKNCLEKSLSNIALGNYILAFKILAFAFATYPSKTFINYKTYIITALLITGPLAKFIASPLRTIYVKIRNGKNER